MTFQPRDDVYGAYNSSYLQTSGPTTHTQSPIVTGTSVVAVKFKDGVVIAADNLGTRNSSIISELQLTGMPD
jgi:20S proteasome subunit beta 7